MPIKTWKKSGVQACFAVFVLLSIHSLFPIAVEGVQESAPRTGEAGIHPKRFSRPPDLNGKLGPEWSDAMVPAEFFEVSPLANAPSPVKTVAYLGYDADNIYFAFRCFDPDVRSIRANLTERDKLEFDDLAGLYIDTLDDGRHAYEFLVNPKASARTSPGTASGPAAPSSPRMGTSFREKSPLQISHSPPDRSRTGKFFWFGYGPEMPVESR